MPGNMKDPIGTTEAATILGVTTRHVRWLIAQGELTATKMGRDHFLSRKDVANYVPRPRGPKKREV